MSALRDYTVEQTPTGWAVVVTCGSVRHVFARRHLRREDAERVRDGFLANEARVREGFRAHLEEVTR